MSNTPSKYRLLNRLNIEDLYNSFLDLEERQRIFVSLGIVFLLLFIFIAPITCATSHLSEIESKYEKTKDKSGELVSKIALYQKTKAELEALKKKNSKNARSTGSLSAIIESLAKKVDIKVRLNPTSDGADNEFYIENLIDVSARKVTLQQVVQFLVEIENYNKAPLRVKKLEVKTASRRNRDELNLSCQISTIRFKQEGEDE